MRLFVPVRLATLLIPSGPDADLDQNHLHVLLTDPVGVEREALLVSVSSVKAGVYHDPTCYLYAGDHEFIDRQTYVVYSRAQLVTEAKLNRGIAEGVFRGRDPMPEEIMARICQGLIDSRHSRPSMRAFYLSARSN